MDPLNAFKVDSWEPKTLVAVLSAEDLSAPDDSHLADKSVTKCHRGDTKMADVHVHFSAKLDDVITQVGRPTASCFRLS